MDLKDIPVTTLKGEDTTFGDLTEGKVALVVNVASRCGLSPQYEQLEELQKRYGDRGFTVVGFPSNQFMQELKTSDAIAEYCSTTWGVTFPMSEKVKVNGKNAHPLFKELKATADSEGKAGRVAWNFEKFLVHPDGRVKRFRPMTVPDAPEVVAAIEGWVGGHCAVGSAAMWARGTPVGATRGSSWVLRHWPGRYQLQDFARGFNGRGTAGGSGDANVPLNYDGRITKRGNETIPAREAPARGLKMRRHFREDRAARRKDPTGQVHVPNWP